VICQLSLTVDRSLTVCHSVEVGPWQLQLKVAQIRVRNACMSSSYQRNTQSNPNPNPNPNPPYY